MIAVSVVNAGIAVACVSNKLGVKCTVFIPNGTGPDTVYFLEQGGSEVITGGDHHDQALKSAGDAVAANLHA